MSEIHPFTSVRAFQNYIESEFRAFKKWFYGDPKKKKAGVIDNHTVFFAQLNEFEDWVSRLTLGWVRDRRQSTEAQDGFYETMLLLREAKYELFRPARSPYSKIKKFLGKHEEGNSSLGVTERHKRRWEAIKTLYIIDLFTYIRIGIDNRIQWQVTQIENRLEKQAENPFSQMANVYRLRAGRKGERRDRFAPREVA